MLVDVAAVLTSVALITAAEATGVPATQTVVLAPASPDADRVQWSLATDPQVAPASESPMSRGLAALDTMGSMSRAELAAWASDHAAVADVLATAPAADAVADWWMTAGAETRIRLATGAPLVVGNLEGLPYTIRDVANRTALGDAITEVEQRLADQATGRAAADQLRAQLHMLQQVQAALAPGDTGLKRSLIGFDPAGGGRAIIAVGDLRTADYVTFLVPGMFYSVDNEIGSWAGAAEQLAADQADWLQRLTPAQHGDRTQTVATVAWIGYQTPTVADVASLDLARQGRDALTKSFRGLEAVRAVSGAPYLTVLAHSYGATATLLALQENDVTVDALAMVGSPGSPAQHVGELKVRNGNVWVADAPLDPVASAGVFGSQPLSPSYGAHRFGVDGGPDPITGRQLAGSFGHVDYFTAGSESFRNMALIGIGRGGYVLDPEGAYSAAPRALAPPVAR